MRARSTKWALLTGLATPSDDERDIVVRLARAETLHFTDNRPDHLCRRRIAMPSQAIDQPLLTELLVALAKRLCNAVGVDRQHVAAFQLTLGNRTIPLPE